MSDAGLEEKSSEQFINVKELWDINFWCDELNLKAEELTEIISEVGPEVHQVRMHLARNLLEKWPLAY